MDDGSGYLPPHELRGIAGNLVDRDDGRLPGPSTATTSSPGLSPAAASPAAFGAPTLPPDDPQSIALAIARIAGESFGGTSVVPLPAPERVLTELGLQGGFGPGISPQLAPSVPHGSAPTDPVAPQLFAATPPDAPKGGTTPPSKDIAGVPSPAAAPSPVSPHGSVPLPDNPLDSLASFGGVVRVPFAPTGDVTGVPTMDVASMFAPPVGGSGALASPPSPPASSSWSDAPSFGGLDLGIDRVPLVGDHDLPLSVHPEPERVSLVTDETPRTPAHGTEPSRARSSSGTAFDPHAVRRDFPILEERVHGKRLVWLDNAATTQKPRSVIDRLTYYYEHENSNVHRAAHALAARATDAFESARETTRRFLGAASTSEIIFVRGATEGINLIAKSWGKRTIERGDEIVLTHLEHHANIVPWQQLCAETGARLRIAPVDERGDVLLDEYEKLMCSRTKLVAFTQVSNALGTITPAREMIAIAHRWGATVLLDGAQAVSHMPVDVQALDCDFYVFSGHKVFAPTGIGAVFGKRALLDAMSPWQGGGNMIADVTFEKTVYQAPPWRFEAGTGNIADAAGLGAALDYVMRIGMPTIARYEHELLEYATERLATVPGLHMIGTAREKAGVLSFILDGKRTEDVGAALDKEGIAVRSGHHCAQPILRRYGLEATVRASLAFYNVPEDIDALVAALRRLQTSA